MKHDWSSEGYVTWKRGFVVSRSSFLGTRVRCAKCGMVRRRSSIQGLCYYRPGYIGKRPGPCVGVRLEREVAKAFEKN